MIIVKMHDELGNNFKLRLVMGQIHGKKEKSCFVGFFSHLQNLVRFISYPNLSRVIAREFTFFHSMDKIEN